VHVLVLWSPHQRPLLEEWQRRLNDAIVADPSHIYVVHAECHRFDHITSGNGSYNDAQWSAAVSRKVGLVSGFAEAIKRLEEMREAALSWVVASPEDDGWPQPESGAIPERLHA
jgi:hypothetical protein